MQSDATTLRFRRVSPRRSKKGCWNGADVRAAGETAIAVSEWYSHHFLVSVAVRLYDDTAYKLRHSSETCLNAKTCLSDKHNFILSATIILII